MIMKFFFCPETMGLYPGGLTGDAVGRPCIELTHDQYRELAGQALALSDEGWPVLAASLPPTAEQLEASERAWRDGELSSTEWLMARHRDELDIGKATTLSAEQYSELLAWRQLLRDWPAADGFPGIENRPPKPEWIEQQTQ